MAHSNKLATLTLTPNEVKLVEAFRRLPARGQENLLKVLALMLDAKRQETDGSL